MTKKELSQLYHLNKEIKQYKKRLTELETIVSKITAGELSDMPKGTTEKDKISKYVAEIADIKKLMELNMEKCIYEANRLNRFISSLPDSEIRQILTLRYIKCMTWQRIAFEIGGYDESYPRIKHNRFLRKFF